MRKILSIGRIYERLWDNCKYDFEISRLPSVGKIIVPHPYTGKLYYEDREINLSDYDAIALFDRKPISLILYDLLSPHCLVIGNPKSRRLVCDKVRTSIILDNAGINTIPSLYSTGDIPKEVSRTLGKDIVIKPIDGSMGIGVELYRDNSIPKVYNKIVQEYIECGATDERWIIVDGDVVCAKRRQARVEGEFRTHDRYGGHSEKIDVTPEMKELGRKVFNCFPGSVWLGIDVFRALSGETYVDEVNSFPFTKTIEITGHNFFEDIHAYIDRVMCENGNPGDKIFVPENRDE